MQIQGYSSAQAVNPFELDPQNRRRNTTQQASSSGDTVEFSAEALELLAKMQAAKEKAAQDEANKIDTAKKDDEKAADSRSRSTDPVGEGKGSVSAVPADGASSDTAEDNKGEGGGKDGGKAGGSGGGSSATSDSTEAEKIRQQIKQLTSSVQAIMKTALPTETKVAQSQPFEAQIQVLEQRLKEVEAQAQQAQK